MFVTFASIEEPNSLTDEEARGLHAELLSGTPSITHTQTAQKIQRAWEQTGEVNLNHDDETGARRGSQPAGARRPDTRNRSVGFSGTYAGRSGRTSAEPEQLAATVSARRARLYGRDLPVPVREFGDQSLKLATWPTRLVTRARTYRLME